MRKCVGKSVVALLSEMEEKDRKSNIMLIDSDLAGSTGFNLVQKAHPEVYVQSGVMERGNFAAAAGFGMHPDKQGVFSTFAAFLEMLCSEITMVNRTNSKFCVCNSACICCCCLFSSKFLIVLIVVIGHLFIRRDSTAPTSFVTLVTPASTIWPTIPATLVSITCSPTTDSKTVSTPCYTSPATCIRQMRWSAERSPSKLMTGRF